MMMIIMIIVMIVNRMFSLRQAPPVSPSEFIIYSPIVLESPTLDIWGPPTHLTFAQTLD